MYEREKPLANQPVPTVIATAMMLLPFYFSVFITFDDGGDHDHSNDDHANFFFSEKVDNAV